MTVMYMMRDSLRATVLLARPVRIGRLRRGLACTDRLTPSCALTRSNEPSRMAQARPGAGIPQVNAQATYGPRSSTPEKGRSTGAHARGNRPPHSRDESMGQARSVADQHRTSPRKLKGLL